MRSKGFILFWIYNSKIKGGERRGSKNQIEKIRSEKVTIL